MPELPEVETIRRVVTREIVGRPISGLHGSSPTLDIPGPDFGSTIKGQVVTSTSRHGKYLFAHLNSDAYLAFHFGMTGDLSYLRSGEPDPAYCQAEISFFDGTRLVFTDPRGFGRITIIPDMSSFIRKKGLGPDALSVPDSEITRIIRKSHRAIKVLLLDQHRIAGIGNIYADEILFQARIHPLRRTGDIRKGEISQLENTIRSVLETAVQMEADFERYPKDWLIPHRAHDETCPVCGGPIDRVRVAGRYAYFCPSCQS